ncbi:hypothetical protein K1719_030349 [Acacia pycnantha]|nr:hypothetical protein K1719_030349 [Acacia pycnantha]
MLSSLFSLLKGALGSTMGSVADLDPQTAAEKVVSVIGHGYDLCKDIRFSSCKSERLIEIDLKQTRDVVFPGGVVVFSVPSSIKCDKGERNRFRFDVLAFNQMSNQFNQELSLLGKMPSGLFNAMFDMKNCWKCLLHGIRLHLLGSLKNTELICKDVVSKDAKLSYPGEVSGNLKDHHSTLLVAQRPFHAAGRPIVKGLTNNDDVVSISVRRGGIDTSQSYNQWLSTISQSPNVISMSFGPLIVLLNSIPGNGFMSHALIIVSEMYMCL